jgi:hypothetical protein
VSLMSEILKADWGKVVDFLNKVHPGGPWVLTAIPVEGGRTATVTFSDASKAAHWAVEQNARPMNVYWTVNRVRGSVDKKPKKGDMEEAVFLHVDIDPRKGEDVAAEQARILARLEGFNPAPTLIVFSGGGYQALFRLDEPLYIGGTAERWEELEAYNRHLAVVLGGDIPTINVDRILRVAGTVNWPDENKRNKGRQPALARLVEDTGNVHPLRDFTPAPSEAEATPVQAGGNVPITRGELRRLADPADLEPWGIVDRLRMLIVQGHDPDNFNGDRSGVVFDLCCNLLRRKVPPELIVGIISDKTWPVSEHVLEKGGRSPIDYAWRQVEQAAKKIAADDEPKPRIVWSDVELARCLDEAEAALVQSGLPIYQMGDRLVQVITVPRTSTPDEGIRRAAGSLVIAALPKHRLLEHFLSTAQFVKIARDAKGNTKEAPFAPPLQFADSYIARHGAWRLPVLAGIATTPTLRSDGSVVACDGYDATSGLIIDTQGVAFPLVPEAPSMQDGRAALEALIDVISEFPFVPDDENGKPGGNWPSQARSAALAMIITAVARPMFNAAPMFGISAPTMATGKSLLADIPAMIVTGRPATKMSQGASEEEDEKRLLSVLMQGDPVNVIDNIARPIEGDALCTILTEETWRCRLLGRSEMRAVGTRALFVATGNNLSFRNDMASRAVLATIDAEQENPGERVFRHDLKAYVPERRAELAVAALTVLRAYITAGRPKIAGMPASRFSDWSVVRSALMWLGEPDPWATNARVAVGDEARAEHLDVMVAVGEALGFGRFFAPTEIMERAHAGDDVGGRLQVALAAALPNGASTAGLGRFLSKFASRRVDGVWIKASPNKKRGGRYAIMTIDTAPVGPGPAQGAIALDTSLRGPRGHAQPDDTSPY